MNNHHMGSGHQIPYHEQSRRQQQYHSHLYGPPPQSPLVNPYAFHPGPPPPFYPHQQPHQYPRWQYAQQYNPYMAPMPQPQPQHMPSYPPRSPLVVSSQPQQPHQPVNAPSMTPRQAPLYPQQAPSVAANSPRPVPQHMSSFVQAPTGLPSPAPTPPKREETPSQASQQLSSQEETRSMSVSDTASAPSRRQSTVTNVLLLPPETRTPYYPNLPWYSPDASPSAFPRRAHARRKRQNLTKSNDTVALPYLSNASNEVQQSEPSPQEPTSTKGEEAASEVSTIAATSAHETPATSQAPSETDFARVSTPTTPAQIASSSPKSSGGSAQQHARKDTRTAIAVPNISGLQNKTKSVIPSTEKAVQQPTPASGETAAGEGTPVTAVAESTEAASAEAPKSPPKPVAPKSWADLVRSKEAKAAPQVQSNGTSAHNGVQSLSKSASLAEALRQHAVADDNLSFLEPRGLVNPGNMCYMNSILQVLVFCSPFYDFLDQVRQRTVHSMKSNNPLLDVMIMFMREFKVLSKGESAEKVKQGLRQEQLEQYGEPIKPEYVYEAIRSLPRFQGMRRGHQQDAEEFLGFLLEGLHDECVGVIQDQANDQKDSQNDETEDANGWLEVGPKQKSAVTRTAGQEDVPSPITKIFGGHLRSELRVPGQKDSVTLEPYKPLQLDIGSPQVNNIVDALKNLTHIETLTGDFGGRGNVTAKKQVFIDTLPPVLILHLKRFQYENALGGTQKIWKKVGYPLELEIPKDVLPPSKRGGLAVKGGLPKFRLTAVVYHHGKSAAGGHYTVDVLRQDSSEWVRMDDTVIRRVRPQDVAEGGAEEDPKLLAKALEQHKNDSDLQKQRNMYEGLDEDDREHEEKPWSEVNGHATSSAKKLAAAAQQSNGTATPTSTAGKRTPTARREGVKDNKVAYILLYERIRS